ncbi:MAG TPA: DUF1801 domain-containing protein [Anaerolineales bacterium]|nr:DUF1801 domain-containing protein [Anaerolineales bacterium]
MLHLHEIEIFLRRTPPHLQDIVWELRNIIASITPNAVETIRWRGLSYFHEGRRGIVSAGICQIEICRDHVRLAFIHGAFLSEPRHLFQGTQKYKRYISLKSYEDAPWDYLKQLIEEVSQFDPRSLHFRKTQLHS